MSNFTSEKTLRFEATPVEVGEWTIVLLPPEVSEQLPSRGMCMVRGQINGANFEAPIEPDGRRGHWLHLTEALAQSTGISAGAVLTLEFEPSETWPQPELPTDLRDAIEADPGARDAWESVTPAARWDWLRWVRATGSAQTRLKRITTACSMLNSGKRRPCCFDRARCTEPSVSSNGLLKTD